jgi:hypothetical protein
VRYRFPDGGAVKPAPLAKQTNQTQLNQTHPNQPNASKANDPDPTLMGVS